jgi:hypothetical protein
MNIKPGTLAGLGACCWELEFAWAVQVPKPTPVRFFRPVDFPFPDGIDPGQVFGLEEDGTLALH